MSNRRNAAAALFALPAISHAAKIITFEPDLPAGGEILPEPSQPKGTPSVSVGDLSEESVRILSYTIYAEARGEPWNGKKAVASVIATRSKRLRMAMADVCVQEKQFSCWNSISKVPSYYVEGIRLKPADIKARSDCYGLAWLLVSGQIQWDYLTHFYNPSKASPSWAQEMTSVRTIGNHVFGYIH